MPPASVAAKPRIVNLDASRGIALILVCLSHFVAVYFAAVKGGGFFHLPEFPIAIGMIASPTFVAISGTILGLLFVVQRDTFAQLRLKLLDRAIFVLTVAHVLIACSRLPYERHATDALRMTFMTDAIGVCVILGVVLVSTTSRHFRYALGLAAFVFAWRLVYLWTPYATLVELSKEVLVGSIPNRVLSYSVPILPWFGVYIACTALGEGIGTLYVNRRFRQVELSFLGIGLTAVSLAAVLRGFSWYLTHNVPTTAERAAFQQLLLSPWSKLPPGPTYVLFFGGIGMLAMWMVSVANHRGWARWFLNEAATLGRASLAVFTLQFYVYYTIMGSLHLRVSVWWPLYFGVSLAVIQVFARWWDRHKLNSLLSVGLDGLIDAVRGASQSIRGRASGLRPLPKSNK